VPPSPKGFPALRPLTLNRRRARNGGGRCFFDPPPSLKGSCARCCTRGFSTLETAGQPVYQALTGANRSARPRLSSCGMRTGNDEQNAAALPFSSQARIGDGVRLGDRYRSTGTYQKEHYNAEVEASPSVARHQNFRKAAAELE
jgi:hypothetical protein